MWSTHKHLWWTDSSGIFDESGIGQPQHFYPLPERPKLRSLQEDPKITRAPCRRRTGETVLRAEIWWFDHSRSQVLNEGCESRHNHRHSVVVRDLATQWIQSYPCKTKASQETERSVLEFLEPSEKPNVIFSDDPLEFGKSCEDLSWNHCTSTPHRSETNGIAERAVRRTKEGTSAVLLWFGLDEKWWADSMECHCYLRHVQDLQSGGKTPYERRFGSPFKGPVIPFGSMIEYHPYFCERPVKAPSIGQESVTWNIPWICIVCGRTFANLNILVADIVEVENWDVSEIRARRQRK